MTKRWKGVKLFERENPSLLFPPGNIWRGGREGMTWIGDRWVPDKEAIEVYHVGCYTDTDPEISVAPFPSAK